VSLTVAESLADGIKDTATGAITTTVYQRPQ
jgi:hypothetical protein